MSMKVTDQVRMVGAPAQVGWVVRVDSAVLVALAEWVANPFQSMLRWIWSNLQVLPSEWALNR